MCNHTKFVIILLTVCMLVSVLPMGASAAVTTTTSVAFNTSSTTQTAGFSVHSNYRYWKIYVYNTSASTIMVELTKDSPTGTQIGSTMGILAGQGKAFYCDAASPLDDGTYYLSIYTDGSSNLSGSLFYKFASSYESLTAGASVTETPSASSEASTSSDRTTTPPDTKHPYTLNGLYGYQECIFTVTSDRPYVKIWCGNTSSSIYTITVLNPSNVQVDKDIAQPNYNVTLYCNGAAMPAGSYKVVIQSSTSAQLTGSLAVRTSDHPITSLT